MPPRRLTPLDVSFLYLEQPTTPMHVGEVALFAPPEGFDPDALVAHIERRIALVPRYRQKVREVPGRLANPVWVDDEDFDITYHVRRSALPRPGNEVQLRELVARVQSRPLDRRRPLWELYLVEGLEGGRLAVISKTHSAVVDGVSALDLGTVLLDTQPTPTTPAGEPPPWSPRREPSAAELVAGALWENTRRPQAVLDTARATFVDVRQTTLRVLDAAGAALDAARTAARPARSSPLNVEIGEARRFAMVRTDLDDHRRVRKHGGTINDVVLAVVAGGLREWLMTRGEPVRRSTTLRAMVPVSLSGTDLHGGDGSGDGNADTYAASAPATPTAAGGDAVSAYFVDLPIGEPSPVVRLSRVSFAMAAHASSSRSVGADVLARLGGFAPPTMHQLGARVAGGLSRRLFNLVVTNVPGPQWPLYAGRARMLEVYPVVPLARGQALAIGVTSYDGGVFYGMNADRDALPDLEVLAECLSGALSELLETVR